MLYANKCDNNNLWSDVSVTSNLFPFLKVEKLFDSNKLIWKNTIYIYIVNKLKQKTI